MTTKVQIVHTYDVLYSAPDMLENAVKHLESYSVKHNPYCYSQSDGGFSVLHSGDVKQLPATGPTGAEKDATISHLRHVLTKAEKALRRAVLYAALEDSLAVGVADSIADALRLKY